MQKIVHHHRISYSTHAQCGKCEIFSDTQFLREIKYRYLETTSENFDVGKFVQFLGAEIYPIEISDYMN